MRSDVMSYYSNSQSERLNDFFPHRYGITTAQLIIWRTAKSRHSNRLRVVFRCKSLFQRVPRQSIKIKHVTIWRRFVILLLLSLRVRTQNLTNRSNTFYSDFQYTTHSGLSHLLLIYRTRCRSTILIRAVTFLDVNVERLDAASGFFFFLFPKQKQNYFQQNVQERSIYSNNRAMRLIIIII